MTRFVTKALKVDTNTYVYSHCRQKQFQETSRALAKGAGMQQV